MMYAGLKNSIVPPNPTHFFNAAYYLIEFTKRGNPDPGLHLSGCAGSMIESALLKCPGISSSNYVFQLDQSSRYRPELSSEQHSLARPVYLYKIGSHNEENPVCTKTDIIEITPYSTFLHFMPFTVYDPSEDQGAGLFIGNLFHVLGQYKSSPHAKDFKLETRSFTLYNSASNGFLLSSFEIGIPENASKESIPKRISLVGANLPIDPSDFSFATDVKQAGFLISSVSPKPGHNEYSITQSTPARYLIVIVDSQEKEFKMRYLSFYGAQVSMIKNNNNNIISNNNNNINDILSNNNNDDNSSNDNSKKTSKLKDSKGNDLPSLPDIVYLPRPVKWVESGNENVCVVGNIAQISKQTSVHKRLLRRHKSGKLACVRGTPSFTMRWDPENNSSNHGHQQPYLLIIDSTKGSLLYRETIKQVRELYTKGFSSVKELIVKSFKNQKQLLEYLNTQNLTTGEEALSIISGYYRICYILRPKEKDDPIELLKELRNHKIFSSIPLLYYVCSGKLPEIPLMTELVWATEDRDISLAFMAMKMNSKNVSFDPHEEFEKDMAEKLTPQRTGSIKSKSARDLKLKESFRRISRSASLERTTSSKILELNNPNAELGPFLYFEVLFVGEQSESPQFGVGLTPKRFFEDQFPGEAEGSYGFFNSGYIRCGDSSKYKFRDLVRATFTVGDVVGCGYNQQQQEIYWTLNGKYLGVAEKGRSQVPLTSKALFATVTTSNFIGRIEANFGESDFKFNPDHLQKIFEHSSTVPEQLSLSKLHPFSQNLFDESHIKFYLPVLASVAQFSSSLQLLLRAYTGICTDEFKILDLSQYRYFTPLAKKSIEIRDIVLTGIGRILPRFCTALNLTKCNTLSEKFFINVPHFSRLTKLSLSGIPELTDESMRLLVSTCKLLQYFRCWEHLTDSGLYEIIKLENLRTLDITGCKEITSAGLHNCLKKTFLSGLLLDSCTQLTDETLNLLIKTKNQNQLERLSVDSCSFSEKALINYIKNGSKLLSLSIARFGGQQINYTDQVASIIAQYYPQIRGLNLYRTFITEKGLHEITSRCKNIEELNLGQTQLSNGSLALLASLPSLSRLELMSLPIEDKMLAFLTQNLRITQLSLHRCHTLTPSGILIGLLQLPDIEFLCLKETRVSDDVSEILSSGKLEKLSIVDLRRTAVTREELKEIAKKNSNLTIYGPESRFGDLDGRLAMMWHLPNNRIINIHRRKRSI